MTNASLYTIYQESFDKGYIQQDWQDRPLHYLPRTIWQRVHSTTLTRPAFALSTKKDLTKATFNNTDKTGLCTIYQERFDKSYIPQHWTDVASWKLFPNKRTATTSYMLIVSSQHRPPLLPRNSPDILPSNRKGGSGGGGQARKMQLHLHTMCANESIGKNTKGCDRRWCLQRSPVQADDGPIWTLTRWTVEKNKNGYTQLGNCSSAPHQLTMSLPQWSPLFPVFYNVYVRERCREWGKQVGSMNEESQVSGCYNITFNYTNQETV